MELKAFIVVLFGLIVLVHSQPDACTFPPQEGVCRALLPSFYFNQQTRVCDCYPFGGCGAGPNHFNTMEQCMQVCQVDPRDQYFSLECERLLGIPATQPISQQIQSVSQPIQEQDVTAQQLIETPSRPGQQAQPQPSLAITPAVLAELQRIVSTLTPAQIEELQRQIQIIRQQNQAQNTIQSQPSEKPIQFNDVSSFARTTQSTLVSQASRQGDSNRGQLPASLQTSPPRDISQSARPFSNDDSSNEVQDSRGFIGVALEDTRPSVISLHPVSSRVLSKRR